MTQLLSNKATLRILCAMVAGIAVGLFAQHINMPAQWHHAVFTPLQMGGDIFLRLIKMLVVPVVLVSIICGVAGLGDLKDLGKLGGSALLLYVLTSMLAIALAMVIAQSLHLGVGMALPTTDITLGKAPPLKTTILNMFPMNPFAALATGNMLQIIVFAILFGMACASCGKLGQDVSRGLAACNAVLMRLVHIVMALTPIGVFCLLAYQFNQLSMAAIGHVFGYFFAVLGTLLLQCFVVYGLFIAFLARLNPWVFFRKLKATMLFAFSISSSNATIPLMLQTVEESLGVDKKVASFVIPLGATINMDGTAIMQGIATVFIANSYGIHLGISGYATVIGMATLASIGTAGVPSVGLITLAMVLQQVGIPTQGIALIIGIDRLLDMVRTAVNITGDAMVACVVARLNGNLDQSVYRSNKT
jgi:Na+/H+-dicarboxylate symporter